MYSVEVKGLINVYISYVNRIELAIPKKNVKIFYKLLKIKSKIIFKKCTISKLRKKLPILWF